MIENKKIIPIQIANRKIELTIFGENSNEETVLEIDNAEAIANGESPFQIKEGCFYEYKINNDFCLETSDVVSQSKVNPSSGRIAPNIYVGTLSIGVLNAVKERCGLVTLEVQSVKTSYRQDYRYMLEEITEKCTDLLLKHSSPVSQFFEVDFNADANTLYQRFAFIKSILDSEEFSDSVHKILSSPVTKWKESETEKDIRSVRRINNTTLRQIAGATNRMNLHDGHSLKSTLQSVPSRIRITYKTETVDTPENRFVKHALTSFLSFIGEFRIKLNDNSRLKQEAILLEDKLEQFLSHSVFKEISLPTTLHLNSPVLQRKEGYREILRVWLMFDLAAKLVWHGGDDVYSGGKRDVAVLYEYWLFFKLLEIIKEVFKIEPKSVEDLIKETADGLGLQLKQGIHIPVKGIYDAGTRKLNVEFSYNKTFSGDNTYPASGSWTKSMRPDYTLSIWPNGINSEIAEREELITHIHFDAKYKVENITGIVGSDEDFKTEKEDQRKGTFKRVDLLKMHSYKDAIRRTAGSYVLYPGTDSPFTKIGFHELIPGLGAFSVRPSKINSGTAELKKFLNEVVHHFLNRASQREKMSLKTYETHKDKNINEVNVALPETYGSNRNLLPDETFVLVGFYDDMDKLDWIEKHRLYNFRTGTDRGSLPLGNNETNARYLLLHSRGETKTGKLYKLTNKGPKIFSRDDLIKKKYPEPSGELYLVYELENEIENEFKNQMWDITKLEDYKTGRGSGLPFSLSLSTLMKAVIKNNLQPDGQ
jgi:predicted component of viral defense system (DUF524 family)